MKKQRTVQIPKIFALSDYPKSATNCEKEVIEEEFELLYGHNYLKRIYADGSADISRFDDNTGIWIVIQFPATVEPDAEDNIRAVIRHNFDVSKCVKKRDEQPKAA